MPQVYPCKAKALLETEAYLLLILIGEVGIEII